MATTNLLSIDHVSTLDRVVDAWRGAHPVVRHATCAAAVTSGMLAWSVDDRVPVRVALLVAGWVMVGAALVDVHERKLPNRLVAIAAMASVLGALATGHPTTVAHCAVGGAVAGSLLMLVRLARGVGMGDVKMAAAIGASVGTLHAMAAPLAIAITAFVAAIYGTMARRARVALGPALWFGWAVAVAASPIVVGWWS